MNIFYQLLFFYVCLSSFGAEVSNNQFACKNVERIVCDSIPHRNTHYNIITNANGYGYDIYANERLLVHQPSVPGISGTKGFRRKAYASKVAELVVKKISQGLMPPTVTQKELDSLKVKY